VAEAFLPLAEGVLTLVDQLQAFSKREAILKGVVGLLGCDGVAPWADARRDVGQLFGATLRAGLMRDSVKSLVNEAKGSQDEEIRTLGSWAHSVRAH
jgi:hypothetical protein